MVNTPKPLIVYKASAGSGKTFTLATEYIKLLVNNPQSYRQILAVTFTNKATEEMKMRILSQLYGISKRLPSSRNYIQAICEALHATPEFVAERAGTALTLLLHNYSYFRVETIDSFFQSVLRNLARELELTANLRIGLNDTPVEELAVDQLIENLSAQDVMLKWLLNYIMDNISEDKSWNVIKQVKQFGNTIFRDYYKQTSKELQGVVAQQGFFEKYTTELRAIRKKAEEHMKGLGKAFMEELEKAGLRPEDLSYGRSGVAAVFLNLEKGKFSSDIIGKRALDCLDAPEKWCKKDASQKPVIQALAASTLNSLLHQVIDEQPKQYSLYQSADLTLRHLSQLRLLDSIEKKVRMLNDESNRFLLSDTQQLLYELIEGSDSPFIYEKIGTQLEHIMIDEFQDTSTVQWKNFKVLLEETMSHEKTENLIVGDVKQSIYRWRSGDWRLLEHIEREFPNASQQLDIRNLDKNYRSTKNVIYFNNTFFTEASKIEGVQAYTDVKQKVPDGKADEGKVTVTLLPSKDYEENTLTTIVSHVEELLSRNISPTDIAILVRTNSQIPLIANYFMEHLTQVKIVSDEAFRLDASPAIQTIIHALQWLIHPDNTIAKAYLAKIYSHEMLHQDNIDRLLPAEMCNSREELLRMPLYELCEHLFNLFHLSEAFPQGKGQSAYLCAFYDQVGTFVGEQSSDITAFLKEWEESICKKTIQSPEIQGIRIISIHKSKGLEFPYVIIPFCDWQMEHRDILWCKPDTSPFSQLPIVPIDYSQKGMKGTIYEKDYDEEHTQNVVDNLNLLYVAFTRASQSLFVTGKRNSKASRSALIEQTLPLIVEPLTGATLTGEQDEEAALTFEYGSYVTVPTVKPKENKDDGNVFMQASEPLRPTIEVFAQRVEFKQSNRSRDFATPPDDEEQIQQNQYIQTGSILHEVFSTINSTQDIDEAISRMEMEGILYNEELSRQRLESLIRKRLEDPRVAVWFNGTWQLYNECTILSTDPLTGKVFERRPDRVMTNGTQTIVVDFKFGRPRDEYHEQVKEYMQLLTRMGHQHVTGYLWFVYSNKIIEVK